MSRFIEFRSIIAENITVTHREPLKYKPDISYI